MHELAEAVARIVRRDQRYTVDAYYFMFESLAYAHRVLGMGTPFRESGEREENSSEPDEPPRPADVERHLTGQELCQAIRQFALEQYGYMAKCVLGNWGIHATGDFGNIVFNLIRAGQMKKTPHDQREDFDDVFDFDTAFCQSFKITLPQ